MTYRRTSLRMSVALAIALTPALHAAEECSSTPVEAVLRELGLSNQAGSVVGYRVRDIVVEATLHRSFLRIESCDHAERPLILLPFAKNVPADSSTTARVPEAVPGTISGLPAVPVGAAVEVSVEDAHVTLAVRGRLLRSAQVGSDVDVELLSPLANNPAAGAKGVRGRLVTPQRVEVKL